MLKVWYEIFEVSVLPTVDGPRGAPSLEKQSGELAWKRSNVMLWMIAAALHVLATYKSSIQKLNIL